MPSSKNRSRSLVILLSIVVALGYVVYTSPFVFILPTVSREDLREGCYLAIALDNFYEKHGRLPSAVDVETFPSRLRFLGIEDNGYRFASGLYGRDILVIKATASGTHGFYVEHDPF